MGYYNFVLRELWPFRETTGTFSLVADTQEYTLTAQLANIDEQNIISVAIQGASAKKLAYWPYNQLRARKPDLDADDTGLPEVYYIKAGKIGFWPSPGEAYTVEVDYFSIPTELTSDTDTPDIPVGYRESLIKYALAQEHDFNTDPDLSQKAMNEYEDIVTLARQNLLSQPVDTGNFTIMGPADAVNHTGLQGEVF